MTRRPSMRLVDQLPVPSWPDVRTFAEARGGGCAGAVAWLHEHGHPVHRLPPGPDRRRPFCAPRAALEAWVAQFTPRAGRRRLSDVQVQDVRQSSASGSALARAYGVSPTTISHIRRGRTYAWPAQ